LCQLHWNSDKLVLRLYDAQEVDETSSPMLYRMVAELARNAELPMPKVYIANQAQPNAFATGRNPEHAAVCATTGIMQLLANRRKPNTKNRVEEATELAVAAFALEQPAFGQVRGLYIQSRSQKKYGVCLDGLLWSTTL
jgi:hypothetical protein